MENIIQLHNKNRETFLNELIEPDGFRSFACKIYDAMTDQKEDCENCLGENFNQLIQTIREDFFENYTPSESTKLAYYFTTYLLWLYLVVERIDFVFDVVNKDNKSKLFSDFKEHNFKTCQTIKKWANFLKHPKEFAFCHWPKYIIEGTEDTHNPKFVIINTEFVKKNYSKSETRISELENCKDVVVSIPDLGLLTKEFCKELNTFFDFICENKIVSDFLKSKTTIDDYYSEPNTNVLI